MKATAVAELVQHRRCLGDQREGVIVPPQVAQGDGAGKLDDRLIVGKYAGSADGAECGVVRAECGVVFAEESVSGADLLPHERLHLCLNRKGVRIVRKTRGDRKRELSHAETLACIGLQHVGCGGDQLLDKSCVAPRRGDRLVLHAGHCPSKSSDPRSCCLAFCRQLRGIVEEGIAIHGRAPFW